MKTFTYISNILRTLGDVFVREAKTILRDQGVVLFFIFLPLAYPVIYSLIYNPELVRDVPVVVVDNDRTSLSRDFVQRFDATQGADVIGYAADMGEAKHALAQRDCYAILEIPHGFMQNTGRGEQARAQLYCEMSLLLRYRALLFSATEMSLAMSNELQTQDISALGVESLMVKDPMPVTEVSLGNIQSGFDSFIMLGVLILILQQSIVLAVGLIGGTRYDEAKRGLKPLKEMAPSTLLSILGRTLCYLAVLTVPIIWLTHYVPLVFRFPMAGNMWEIILFLLPMVLSSICLGLVVQVFTRERESIFIIWVATSVFFLFLSGLTWPRYAMSPFWQFLGDLLPTTWGVNGFLLMNANGATLADVQPFYDKLWILTGLYFVLAWALHRFYLRPTLQRISHENSRPAAS